MERFADLLQPQPAGCNGSDSEIVYTFKDQASYNEVKKSWGWVNQQTFRSFIVSLDNRKCQLPQSAGSPARKPYQVNRVSWDDAKFVARLSATPKSWLEAVGGEQPGQRKHVAGDHRHQQLPDGART